MNCTRCNKRLSRKTARLIDGKVLCSTCMFTGAAITDCGPDGGCEECDVCRYLYFIEWAQSVGPPGSRIERNEAIEAYLRRTYPHAYGLPAIGDRSRGSGGDAEGGSVHESPGAGTAIAQPPPPRTP